MAEAAAVQTLWNYVITHRHMEQLPNTFKRIYRGQAEEWPLLPCLFREPNTVRLVKKNECRILEAFKDYFRFTEEEFTAEIRAKNPSKPKNDWDWLSFGQHFGLPTRLLDWSANPLKALFFAVEKSPKAPIVYVYDAKKDEIVRSGDKKTSPFTISLTRIVKPNPHSTRSTLQEAWHTVHTVHKRNGREVFVPLANTKVDDGRTRSIRIDPAYAERIRDELARLLINHQTMYGDFEVLCKSIGREFGMRPCDTPGI